MEKLTLNEFLNWLCQAEKDGWLKKYNIDDNQQNMDILNQIIQYAHQEISSTQPNLPKYYYIVWQEGCNNYSPIKCWLIEARPNNKTKIIDFQPYNRFMDINTLIKQRLKRFSEKKNKNYSKILKTYNLIDDNKDYMPSGNASKNVMIWNNKKEGWIYLNNENKENLVQFAVDATIFKNYFQALKWIKDNYDYNDVQNYEIYDS